MSGGSYDYAYTRVNDFADQLRRHIDCNDCGYSNPSLRRAFLEHLLKVSDAMQAIEWNDSSDGDKDEQAKIQACLAPGEELAAVVARAKEVQAALTEALERAGKTKPV
jgi:hypothetical protein